MWWLVPVIPALRNRKQKDCLEFDANLVYIETIQLSELLCDANVKNKKGAREVAVCKVPALQA